MKALEGTRRRAVQVLLAALTLGTLVIPPLVVATSGTATYSATWTALRILALYALTVLFLNIMTGSFRPLLARVFKPKLLFRLHNATGLVGFSMAVAHMILVITEGLWQGLTKLGPVTLYILTATTAAALLRKYLKKSWRMIHRLNYAVFIVALVHAFQLGIDLRKGAFLKVVLYIYTALVAAAFVYRLQLTIRTRLKKKAAGA
jgi:DMSO/TMAO reductase YedYZ heme-binding membrane subunit